MSKTVINRFSDSNAVAENTAAKLIESLTAVLAEQNQAHVMLTGGTVGIATLAALGSHPLRDSIDYDRVHFWWGDERYVSTDSGDRNALQARNAFISKIKIKADHVHEFPSTDSGLSLEQAAEEFANHVSEVAPKFDIVLLGMGPDGHIASLFPGKAIPEPGIWIIAEPDSPKPPAQRLSFTYEALNSANEIWFVVAGADKQDAVSVAMGDKSESLPVGRVHGKKFTRWFIDATAATKEFGC